MLQLIPHQDPDHKPFATRPWNQTSAKSCSLQLAAEMQGVQPVLGRPDRIASFDRRNRGSALHEFGRLSLHLLLDKGKWPNPERTLQAVLKSAGGKDQPGQPLSFMKGAGFPDLQDVVGELLPKAILFQQNFEFKADDRIGNEHFVAIDANGEVCSFWDVPPGGYHGRIDWAELSGKDAAKPFQLRVIDFKNRPAIHPMSELKAHEQLSFYAWMLGKHFPQALKQDVVIGIYYFEYGFTDTVELTWDEIERNVARLLARIRAKQRLRLVDIVPEPAAGRCQYCQYLSDCPAGAQLLDGSTSAPVDMATAIAAGKRLFVLDEEREALREGLKSFCEENGPIRLTEDSGWGFIKQPDRETLPMMTVIERLKKEKIDPYRVLKIDMSELDKIIKENKDLSNLIVIDRFKSTFKPYKPTTEKSVVMTPMAKERAANGTDAPKKKAPKKKATKTVTPTKKKESKS